MRELTTEANRIQNEHKLANLSVIYTGDFNSRPESQVYNLIKNHTFPSFDFFTNDLEIEEISNPELAKTLG